MEGPQMAAEDDKPWMLSEWESDDEDYLTNPSYQEAMMNQTIEIAREALKFYNTKEVVQYELDKPLFSKCFPFPLTLVCHAIFTAEKLDDGGSSSWSSSSSSQENSPSSPLSNPSPSKLFFAETVTVYKKGCSVLCCVIMDPDGPDRLRESCLHCGTNSNQTFYHPPLGTCKYGDFGGDYERFEFTSSDDEC